MAVNINNVVFSTSTGNLEVSTTTSSDLIYKQLSDNGIVFMPSFSSGATSIPMFNVGWSTGSWTNLGGVIPFSYTGGGGYYNVSSCYNTSTYRFTAPWNGLYFFKQHIYIYGNNSTVTWYTHPLFMVNGSYVTRRPGGPPYRMRLYGIPASFGQDTDCCEQIYLNVGDYVQVAQPMSGTVQGLQAYSAWAGVYLGN